MTSISSNSSAITQDFYQAKCDRVPISIQSKSLLVSALYLLVPIASPSKHLHDGIQTEAEVQGLTEVSWRLLLSPANIFWRGVVLSGEFQQKVLRVTVV